MAPLVTCLVMALGFALLCWVLTLLTRDASWVDRLWSITPWLYAWVFAGFAHLADLRLDLMAVVATVWGLRLTFNFARKGGYSGMEDYRWEVVRSKMRPWQWQLFNLFFVDLYQHLLLLAIALPAWTAFEHRGTAMGAWGWVLLGLFVACTLGETVADEQQWRFHQAKAAATAEGRRLEPPFLTTGLFSASRHPNFFFEQAQWWLFFGLGAAAAGSVLQWTIVGPVLLSLLFVGSTQLTESISLSKYPEYADYRRRVPRTIPYFPRFGRTA
jgi:steroid 5-alpha reductase family enzyme